MNFFRYIIFAFFILIFNTSFAQDKHFSQVYFVPSYLNPAMSGGIGGKYRLGIVNRNQWKNVLEQGVNSFAAMLEVNVDMDQLFKMKYKDKLGVSLTFYSNKVGIFEFSSNEIDFSFAYYKSLDQFKKHYLSIGFQAGISQRNINYENLNFQDQYVWGDGFHLDSREDLPLNNFAFGDYALGIHYIFNANYNTSVKLGASMDHVFEPNVSFYAKNDNFEDYPLFLLDRKYTGYISTEFGLNKPLSIIPRLIYTTQGNHAELLAGTNFRFRLDEFNSKGFYAGGWARIVNNFDGLGLDSFVTMVGFDFNSMTIGLSYDTNFRSISNFGKNHGAFEFSISYLGNYDGETVVCPKF